MTRDFIGWNARCRRASAAALWLGLLACGGSDNGQGGAEPPGSGGPYVPARGSAARLEIDAIDKIDVLFVIDTSNSMREEQQTLVEQFPRIARALASGDIDADGTADFPAPDDVQFGVITPELGLAGIEGITNCEGPGDDGLLQPPSRAPLPGCPPELPAFVRYQAGQSDVDQVAAEFACLAAVGTGGCGFEQPLEAALKALWPASDERVTFLEASGRMGGHGDGANAGFSRAAAGTVPSLLVIVLIADEDDCSAFDTLLFLPNPLPDDPLAMQDLNLRCMLNPHRLYPLERYGNALPLLRPGAEQLVMFAAITGVPPDLVDREATAEVDFGDREARAAFYGGLLDDPRMQERIDESRPQGQGSLTAVCRTDRAVAYPARRIVQVAQGFGENGMVQSICQDDFSDVIGFILQRVAHRMRNPA